MQQTSKATPMNRDKELRLGVFRSDKVSPSEPDKRSLTIATYWDVGSLMVRGDEVAVLVGRDGEPLPLLRGSETYDSEAFEWAELIAKAVNGYDALVASLREIVVAYEDEKASEPDIQLRLAAAMPRAHAALAKALASIEQA